MLRDLSFSWWSRGGSNPRPLDAIMAALSDFGGIGDPFVRRTRFLVEDQRERLLGAALTCSQRITSSRGSATPHPPRHERRSRPRSSLAWTRGPTSRCRRNERGRSTDCRSMGSSAATPISRTRGRVTSSCVRCTVRISPMGSRARARRMSDVADPRHRRPDPRPRRGTQHMASRSWRVARGLLELEACDGS